MCLDLPKPHSHAGLLQPGLLSVPSCLFTPTKAFVTKNRVKGGGHYSLCRQDKWWFNLWRCLSKPAFILCRQLSPFRNSSFGNTKSKPFVKNWILCYPGNVSYTTREFLSDQLLSVGLFGWSSSLPPPPHPYSHLIFISRISPRQP